MLFVIIMATFSITLSQDELAEQIANLLNIGNQLAYFVSPEKIKTSSIEYIVELDRNKVVGVIGVEKKNKYVTELKHLCVDPNYRGQHIGKKLLSLGVNQAKTKIVYGTVREDNKVNINNNLSVGLEPVARYSGRNCYIIIFARRRRCT
jgi:ribosomal protein S18 acetylase RimI-like enzyme